MLEKERVKPGMNFMVGVVEENNTDPLFMNRHRVRVIGVHTEIKEDLPSDKLPWAIPLANFGGTSWTGESTPVYENGTWVLVTFTDETAQELWIFGSIGGWPQKKPDASKGFSDPNGVYPMEKRIGKQDLHPHVRKESKTHENTDVVKDRLEGIDSVAKEPAMVYEPKYTRNRVIHFGRGECNNLIEVDDTPGAERIHIYHTSGSFIEMFPDGNIVIKTKDTHHEIHESDKHEHVFGTSNVFIDGDWNVTVGGNFNLKVKGTWNIDVDNGIHEKSTIHTMKKK